MGIHLDDLSICNSFAFLTNWFGTLSGFANSNQLKTGQNQLLKKKIFSLDCQKYSKNKPVVGQTKIRTFFCYSSVVCARENVKRLGIKECWLNKPRKSYGVHLYQFIRSSVVSIQSAAPQRLIQFTTSEYVVRWKLSSIIQKDKKHATATYWTNGEFCSIWIHRLSCCRLFLCEREKKHSRLFSKRSCRQFPFDGLSIKTMAYISVDIIGQRQPAKEVQTSEWRRVKRGATTFILQVNRYFFGIDAVSRWRH